MMEEPFTFSYYGLPVIKISELVKEVQQWKEQQCEFNLCQAGDHWFAVTRI